MGKGKKGDGVTEKSLIVSSGMLEKCTTASLEVVSVFGVELLISVEHINHPSRPRLGIGLWARY